MNKKSNLFNQVIISSIEDYKDKIEKLTKQKERLIRRDKKHREEIERLQHNQEVSTKWEIELNNRITKAIEYLKQECLYDGKTYCDDLWCGDIPKLVTILKGSDKE